MAGQEHRQLARVLQVGAAAKGHGPRGTNVHGHRTDVFGELNWVGR